MEREKATAAARTADDAHSVVPIRPGVAAVGLIAGLASSVGGPQPVGDSVLSGVMVTLAVATVCWIGSWAPRRLLAWTVLLAGVSTAWLPAIVVALGIFLIVELGERRVPVLARSSPYAPLVSAVLSGATMALASRSELSGFLGASTVMGVLLGSSIVIAGLRRCTARVRRSAGVAALAAVIGAVLASGVFAGLSMSVTDDVRDAEQLVRTGLDQLGDADISAAEASFSEASERFRRADDRLASPIGAAAAAVPVVAQHRSAATVLSGQAALATDRVADLLEGLDADALTFADSRIDLDTVAAFGVALDDIQVALDALDDDIAQVSSPWLVPAASSLLDELRVELGDQRARAERARAVTTALPPMLGGIGERVYLVLFTTPAEARGLGGFTGNWAEITAVDGRIDVSAFGRSDELDNAAPPGTRAVSGPAEWLDRYGAYGFTSDPGGTVGADPFKNITMSPSMSSTGEVVAELYPQSGGRELDGVFAADVYVLADLLRFTGPVELAGDGRTIGVNNAAEFLLNRQYAIPNKDDRIDSIAEASDSIVERLLTGGVDVTPSKLLRVLGPRAEQGRLAGWAAEPEEQQLLVDLGLAGTLQPLSTDDAVTMAFNNAAGNKADYFLRTSARYEAQVRVDGTVDGVYEVTLENGAPSQGQPRYVIANAIDAPLGTNQTLVSLFSALPPAELTVNGAPRSATSGLEMGYHVTDVVVRLAPGETATVRLRVSGQVDVSDGYSLFVRSPPSVASTPVEVDVRVETADGERTISETLQQAGVRRVDLDLSVSGR